MQKRKHDTPQRWVKPEVRRLLSGSAAGSPGGGADGSGTFS
jgi:hypothetical protein